MSYHGEWSRNFLWTFTYLLNIKINIQIVNHLTLMRMMVQSFLHYNEHSCAPSSSSSRASNNKLGKEQGYLWETRVSQTQPCFLNWIAQVRKNVGQDLTKIANFFTFWFVFTHGENMYTNLFPLILTYQPKLA